MDLLVCSLSWPAFLQVRRGEPNSSENKSGDGANTRCETIRAVTFRTEPVS
jgi:hypothetical protein